MGPVVAPNGTVTLICVSEFTVKEANTPLNETPVVDARLVPVMVTGVPMDPLVGVKLLIVGAGGSGVTTTGLLSLTLPARSTARAWKI